MRGPWRIAILAVLNVLWAGFFLFLGIVFGLELFETGGFPLEDRVALTLLCLGFGIATGATGVGLWKLRTWARKLFIIFWGAILALLALRTVQAIGDPPLLIVVGGGLAILLFWYWLFFSWLNRPDAKQAFGIASPTSTEGR